MKTTRLIILALASALFFIASCDDDNEPFVPTVPPSNLDYPNHPSDTVTIGFFEEATSGPASILGDTVISFSFTSRPYHEGDMAIDNSTGEIIFRSTLSPGFYEIDVTAVNEVASQVFRRALVVNKLESPPTFSNDIQPLLQSKCAPCHTNPEGGLPYYLDYANASQAIEAILDRVQRSPDEGGFMPMRGEPLSAEEVGLLQGWQNEGLIE